MGPPAALPLQDGHHDDDGSHRVGPGRHHAEAPVEQWVDVEVDDVGVGAGVLDRLLESDVDVVGFNGGSSPIDKDRFINARAEAYWMLREAFEQGEIDIDPTDDQLAAQLGSLKWTLDSRGRTKIESKDDMRKRGMPSPDRADAVMMPWAASAIATVDVGCHQGGSITSDLLGAEW